MAALVSLGLAAAETVLLAAASSGPYRAIVPAPSATGAVASNNGVYQPVVNSMGIILPQVAVEEAHNDTVTTTKNPVELGAAITDHAYVEPAQLILRYGFSDAGNYSGYVNAVYNALLSLQAARGYLNVYTGRRVYRNMLLVGLQVVTDQVTSQSLVVVARLEQIIVVTTSSTTLPPSTKQAIPEQTAPPVNAGTQQTQPATAQNVSVLASFSGVSGNTP